MAEPALEARALRKDFGEKTAVRDLTLSVPRGEVFGFLGPNGAGKTTSIKMFLGLAHPTAGGGRLLGEPLGNVRARARVGYLPEHFAFHEWLTGRELLRFHGRLLGLGGTALDDADRGASRAGRAPGRRRPGPARVQQGHAAADRARAGPPRPARDRLSRRADVRPRPARTPPRARRDPRAARGRHRRLPQLAPPRRGRGDVRPGRVREGRPGGARDDARRRPTATSSSRCGSTASRRRSSTASPPSAATCGPMARA